MWTSRSVTTPHDCRAMLPKIDAFLYFVLFHSVIQHLFGTYGVLDILLGARNTKLSQMHSLSSKT